VIFSSNAQLTIIELLLSCRVVMATSKRSKRLKRLHKERKANGRGQGHDQDDLYHPQKNDEIATLVIN
jgi:hypothetical protein